jgi:hypothetical protein
MPKKILSLLALLLFCCLPALAQQSTQQPLTFWYAYKVNPGKEADFMNLVKAIGQPVRDKLMAEGVVLAWGIEVPLLRHPDGHSHLIWYTVADLAGVEKVQMAMDAQRATIAAEEAKTAAEPRKKNQKPAMTTEERVREVFDASKTRDYLTRDQVFGSGSATPPAGSTPYTRYAFIKVKPGKGSEYRAAWEKYTKPIYDKLIADGVLWAYGYATEELKTDGDFTLFIWTATKDMAGMDKVRAAVIADRMRRSQEERDAIGDLFGSMVDPDAARQMMTRAIMFHVPGQK